jgi:hypothetical protein
MRRLARRPRLFGSGALVVLVASVALVLVPSALNSSTKKDLSAYVVVSSRGPLPPCAGTSSDPCTLANTVYAVVHVKNDNEFQPADGAMRSRETLVDAFVVSSIDWATTVDGVAVSTITITPPPSPSISSWAGNWVSTATCASGAPCVVGHPAVIPGEDVAVFYHGWAHGVGDPNGKYEFAFTVHGTVNGEAVDLTATSPQIKMVEATATPPGKDDNHDSHHASGIEKVKITLVSPGRDAVIAQNVSTIGCTPNPTTGYGNKIEFAWKANHDKEIAGYELLAQHRGSPVPIVSVTLNGADSTSFAYRSCHGFVIDSNLNNWEWSVRAIDDQGQKGAWTTGNFRFAPCRLENGNACYAPAP